MRRAILVFCSLFLLLASCTQRMICPAYQSAFIYDKDELRKKFSYFQNDTTPKIYTASKTKYLIAEPVSYYKKVRSMQTVAMKPVPVVVPDSLVNKDSVTAAALDAAARSVLDSTFIVDTPKKDSVAQPQDTVYVITKDKELRLLKYNAPDSLDYDSATQKYVRQVPKYYVANIRYNMEQDTYMWYLRDVLVLPDVRLAKLQQEEGGGREEKKDVSAKKEGGFFKDLFRKKPKEEADTTALQSEPKEEFDFIDTTEVQAPVVGANRQTETKAPKKERKPFFGRKKKSPDAANPKKKEDQKPVDKKKKEDEDDGF